MRKSLSSVFEDNECSFFIRKGRRRIIKTDYLLAGQNSLISYPHYRRNHMWHVTWFICIRTNYDRFKNRKICKNTILYECTVQSILGEFQTFLRKYNFRGKSSFAKLFFQNQRLRRAWVALIFNIGLIFDAKSHDHNFFSKLENFSLSRNLVWNQPHELFCMEKFLVKTVATTIRNFVRPKFPWSRFRMTVLEWRHNWWRHKFLRNSCLGVFLHLRQ